MNAIRCMLNFDVADLEVSKGKQPLLTLGLVFVFLFYFGFSVTVFRFEGKNLQDIVCRLCPYFSAKVMARLM